MRVNKIALAGLVLCGSVLMTACGGGSDDTTPVAANNAVASINPKSGAAVVSSVLNQDFVFPAGVADFGTTGPTSVTLAGTGTGVATGATPTFSIKSGVDAATGEMTYGSCIFTVTNSTFAAGHPLALGATITVTPCELKLQTAGKPATGVADSVNVQFVLGAGTSDAVPFVATINPNGTVVLNGSTIGEVTVVAATGASN